MAKTGKRTTVYSLSEELNVSVATVSKALRGSAEISAEMRKKVRGLAQKRNFTPRVVSRKVPNICVLIQQYPGHSLDFNPFLSTVMEGVSSYIQEEGLEMSIYADTIENLNHQDIVRELRRRGIDGAIVLRANDESHYLNKLDEEGVAHCALLSTSPSHSGDSIIINNNEVAFRATRHLIENGHRRIGILVSPPGGVTGETRLNGYRRALDSAQIPFDPALVAYEGRDENGLQFGCDTIQRLVANNPDMTAVFAMDHAVVVGLLHGLSLINIKVPEDLSVISCDDYPETAFLCPPVSVIDIPNRELGYQAAKLVFRRIRNLPPLPLEDSVCLDGKLIKRESVRKIQDTPHA